jgi:hypothetical protein
MECCRPEISWMQRAGGGWRTGISDSWPLRRISLQSGKGIGDNAPLQLAADRVMAETNTGDILLRYSQQFLVCRTNRKY